MKLSIDVRRLAVSITLAACTLTNSGLASQAQAGDKDTIKIGFVTSTTGVAGPIGEDMVKGINLFMDQIHGKIAGKNVQLIVENDGSNPAQAIEKVTKLAEQDHVNVIGGFLLATVGYAVTPLADKFQTPMIVSIAAGDDMTQRKLHNYVIRLGPTSSQANLPFGEWVYKKLGYKRVVCFGMDYPFGYEVVGAFQKGFEDAGGQVVQKIWAPLGFTDFSSYLKEMRKDADAVYLINVGKAAEVLPKQYKEEGPKLPILGNGTSFDEGIIRHVGDEAIGATSALDYAATLDTPANRKFVAAYSAKYHEDPSYYAESAYVTGLWIKKAIESLHGDVSNSKDLLAAIKKVELPDAPRGAIKLDKYGNMVSNIYVRRVEKKNGKLQNTVIATFPNASQFWKYNPDQYLKQPAYSKTFPPCTHCAAK